MITFFAFQVHYLDVLLMLVYVTSMSRIFAYTTIDFRYNNNAAPPFEEEEFSLENRKSKKISRLHGV